MLISRRSIPLRALRIVTALVLGISCSGVAFAQEKLGELLDAGGKKLSKDELVATMSGANVSYSTPTGGKASLDFKADGSVSGSISGGGTRNYPGTTYGTWVVDDAGRLCQERKTRIGDYSAVDKPCGFVFLSAGQYYFSGSDSDRNSRLAQRVIKK
ncbi:MAG: hypothetical protein ABI900_10520 [Betaproteobacteria bacterium]